MVNLEEGICQGDGGVGVRRSHVSLCTLGFATAVPCLHYSRARTCVPQGSEVVTSVAQTDRLARVQPVLFFRIENSLYIIVYHAFVGTLLCPCGK